MTENKSALTIRELNHVAVYVRDMERSVKFYSEVLGLPRLQQPGFGFTVEWFSLGTQELHLILDESRDGKNHPFHFALQVADAYAATEELRKRGVTEFRGPAPRPDGAVQVFIEDPDGYVVELVSFPKPI